MGLPVPDETLLTFSGYLVFKGNLSLPLAFARRAWRAARAASPSATTLGRTFGLELIHRYGRYMRITEEHVIKAHAWFERVGHWGLTFGYFVPGVRHLTAYAAGMSEVAAAPVCAVRLHRRLLWAATFLSIGYLPGRALESRGKQDSPVRRALHHYYCRGPTGCVSDLAMAPTAQRLFDAETLRRRGNAEKTFISVLRADLCASASLRRKMPRLSSTHPLASAPPRRGNAEKAFISVLRADLCASASLRRKMSRLSSTRTPHLHAEATPRRHS